jgi:hypothetical protein
MISDGRYRGKNRSLTDPRPPQSLCPICEDPTGNDPGHQSQAAAQIDPSWAKLVHTCSPLDVVDGLAEVARQEVGDGDGVRACLDLYGPAAAGGLEEFANGRAGLLLDPAADGHGSEHMVRWTSIESLVRWVDGPSWPAPALWPPARG